MIKVTISDSTQRGKCAEEISVAQPFIGRINNCEEICLFCKIYGGTIVCLNNPVHTWGQNGLKIFDFKYCDIEIKVLPR